MIVHLLACAWIPEAPSNSAPTAPTVSIVPSIPRAGVDDLSCELSGPSEDPDGDPLTYSVRWLRDGAETGLTDIVAASETTAGEHWTCEMVANDGALDSPPGVSTTQVIAPFEGWPSSTVDPMGEGELVVEVDVGEQVYIAGGDADADGRSDLWVAWDDGGEFGQLYVWDSASERGQEVANLGRVSDLVVGDIDDDGEAEAVVATSDGAWIGGVGSGGVQGEARAITAVALGSVDGDGAPDPVWMWPEGLHVDGREITPSDPLGRLLVCVGRPDDGDLIGVSSTLDGESTLGIFRADTASLDTPDLRIELPDQALAAASGDLDGDGYEDVVVGASGEVRLYSGAELPASGRFDTPVATLEGGTMGVFVEMLGDLDGDGHEDLGLGDGETVSVFIGLGMDAGTLEDPTVAVLGPTLGGVGDTDADGLDDLGAADEGAVWLLLTP